MVVGELAPEAARQLAIACTEEGGRLPNDVLDYIVEHSGGICLAIEQMSVLAPAF